MNNSGFIKMSCAVCAAMNLFSIAEAKSPAVETFPFGNLSTGEPVTLYRLHGDGEAYMDVIDYGCRVVGINVPDREGNIVDVVPGYDNIKYFETGDERYFGAVIGRFGNRIAGGTDRKSVV